MKREASSVLEDLKLKNLSSKIPSETGSGPVNLRGEGFPGTWETLGGISQCSQSYRGPKSHAGTFQGLFCRIMFSRLRPQRVLSIRLMPVRGLSCARHHQLERDAFS